MKPAFSSLSKHYPAEDSREDLLKRIGWTDVLDDPRFKDTCAIRMSVGLAGAGAGIPGARMSVNAVDLGGSRSNLGRASYR